MSSKTVGKKKKVSKIDASNPKVPAACANEYVGWDMHPKVLWSANSGVGKPISAYVRRPNAMQIRPVQVIRMTVPLGQAVAPKGPAIPPPSNDYACLHVHQHMEVGTIRTNAVPEKSALPKAAKAAEEQATRERNEDRAAAAGKKLRQEEKTAQEAMALKLDEEEERKHQEWLVLERAAAEQVQAEKTAAREAAAAIESQQLAAKEAATKFEAELQVPCASKSANQRLLASTKLLISCHGRSLTISIACPPRQRKRC